MNKLANNKPNHALWQKAIVALLGMSLLIMFMGVSGIVEHKSPVYMETVGTLATSVLAYYEYHALIIAGALGFTFSVWLIDHH